MLSVAGLAGLPPQQGQHADPMVWRSRACWGWGWGVERRDCWVVTSSCEGPPTCTLLIRYWRERAWSCKTEPLWGVQTLWLLGGTLFSSISLIIDASFHQMEMDAKLQRDELLDRITMTMVRAPSIGYTTAITMRLGVQGVISPCGCAHSWLALPGSWCTLNSQWAKL